MRYEHRLLFMRVVFVIVLFILLLVFCQGCAEREVWSRWNQVCLKCFRGPDDETLRSDYSCGGYMYDNDWDIDLKDFSRMTNAATWAWKQWEEGYDPTR